MNDDISTIFISAGEPSGDIHAAELVLSLKNLSPKIKFIGNGGDKMIEAGVNVNNHISSMSVMGFIDVVKHLPKLLDILNNTVSTIKLSKPDKIIGKFCKIILASIMTLSHFFLFVIQFYQKLLMKKLLILNIKLLLLNKK